MDNTLPEKAGLLEKLKQNRFNVPDFIYVPAADFENRNFDKLAAFLEAHKASYKVIARSAHPAEHHYKGGTFDSLDTYADIAGIEYARKKIIKYGRTAKHLSIQRQQRFNSAPDLDLDAMGVIVMPFVSGANVMAKMIGDHWEFGYSRNRSQKVQSDPHITNVPHDRKLLHLSQQIQKHLGFKCEIEYIISNQGDIHVVQAKNISDIETLEDKERELSIRLDGIRRIRRRRNYRERPVYVMDNKAFYIQLVSQCEAIVQKSISAETGLDQILESIQAYETDLESFAMRHQRFAVLGFSIHNTGDLFQIANHYLDDFSDLQEPLSKALHKNLYKIDIFLSEADTLIAKDRFRINLCSHDAYGIDSVRNPIWSAYWKIDRHDAIVREFKQLGFKTGDTIAVDIDPEDRPRVSRH